MFKSIFKEYVESFINEKRICGYKYQTNELDLSRFDEFLYLNNINLIDQDIILLYVELHPNWSVNTKARVIGNINELLKYLKKYHLNEYVIPKKLFQQNHHNYIPYIFSKEEMHKIFEASDHFTSKKYLEMKYIVPVYFRLLYGTGMRHGECISIKRKNVDLLEGTIKLENTKNGTERLIVLSNSLIIYLKQYMEKMNRDSEYLFYNAKGDKLSINNMERIFYKLLEKIGIRRSDNSPRVHDLRFTFITHSFRKYCATGKDPYAFLPVLQTYVGHQSVRSLEYYIKTTKLDQEMVKTLSDEKFGYIIPRGDDDNDKKF